MSFLDSIRARAASRPARIAFPETDDPRTLDAVRTLARERIVEPVLVLAGAATDARSLARELGLEIVDPATDARREAVTAGLLAARGRKGLDAPGADALARTALYFADWLVAVGEVSGCVAGAAHTTGDVLRAALALVGPAPGVRTVSSAFYMVVPPFRDAAEEVLTFTDCAVVRYPTAEQLADIATAAARDRRRIVGDEPVVALLSFSTRGSAGGESVRLVTDALGHLRDRMVDFAVDGELQGDAALVPGVGSRKAPGSAVAGRANVLVFPTLDAGNIAYKLVQRLARASAVGPIVQGLARPCSDLSRGAVPDDIINVAAITALQARGTPEHEGLNPAGEKDS